MKKTPSEKRSSKKVSHPKKQIKRNKYSDLAGLAIIILLGTVIYSNSFSCSFHFDDVDNLVNNPDIRNLSYMKALDFHFGRSFAFFTFALNYHFNQLDVRGYHLVNLIIHLINSVMIWWLVRLIFSSPAIKDHQIVKYKNIIAFITALLFVTHPLATQSVTYIIQRLASMVALFYLLSLALYVKARLLNKGAVSKTLLFGGSLIAAILAMHTKENAFTLPFTIVLFEIFFLRTKQRSINFKDWRVILVSAALAGFMILINLRFSFSIFNPIPPQQGHTYTLTPYNYLLTQFSVIVKYIFLLCLPVNQMLDYDFPVSSGFLEWRTFLSFFFIISLIALSHIIYKKQRLISFGILWFFLTLSVESGFIPIADVIFEHRTYLPSFGYFLVISSILYGFLWPRNRALTVVIIVMMVISNSFLTWERNKIWKDDMTLWDDNIKKAPDLARPVYERGFAYGILGQWDKSAADYSKAIRINPEFDQAWCSRGYAFWKLGMPDSAIADYSRAITINPEYLKAYYNRAATWESLGHWDKAIADYTRMIGINPESPDIYASRGVAYGNTGQFEQSIADCSKAISLDPHLARAWCNLGLAYGNLRQWEKAISNYTKAIEIDPEFTNAYFNRGCALANLELWNDAIADFSKALELDPGFTKARNFREMAQKRLGNLKER